MTVCICKFQCLFTNSPVEDALDCLKQRLRQFHYSDVEVKEFVNFTKICIFQTTFVFNDKYYKQFEGLSRRSPIFPIFYDISIHYFEKKIKL